MEIICHACTEGTNSAGTPCSLCGGDGSIDLLDSAFKQIKVGAEKLLMGLIWSTLLTNQADLSDKVDDVLDKCNDVLDKCNDIMEKLKE